MNKKFKILFLFISLIVLIFLVKISLNVKLIKYKINFNGNKVFIEERLSDEYAIKIKYLNKEYILRLNRNISEKRKIVSQIYYFKDDTYECLLPVIDGKVYTDFMCYSGNIIYNYHDIYGYDKLLDQYVLGVDIYNIDKFTDNLNNEKKVNGVKFYTNNIKDYNISITTYDGIISLYDHVKLFENDVYNNKLSAFVDNYYIVADYNNNYEFKDFYIVDILTNKVSTLKSKYEISLDSYIEGIVDKKIYLYDKDNEIQYEIDIERKKINIVSNEDKIKFYKNGKWEIINKSKAYNELYFDYTSLDNLFPDYEKTIETDKYYYLFENSNDGYNLYRVDKANIKILSFICFIKTNQVNVKDDYLYFVYNNRLYYYSDIRDLKLYLSIMNLSIIVQLNITFQKHILSNMLF